MYPTRDQYWTPLQPDRPIFVGDILRTEQLLPELRADFAVIVGPAQLNEVFWYAPTRLISAKTHLDAETLRAGRHNRACIWLPDWHHPRGTDWYADLNAIGAQQVQSADIARERVACASAPAWVAISHRLSQYATGTSINGAQFLLEHGIDYPRGTQEVAV